MIRRSMAVFTLALSCFLTACGAGGHEKTVIEDEASIEETSRDLEDEADFSSAAAEEWLESTNGEFKFISYGYNQDIGLDLSESSYVPLEAGPVSVTIQNVSVVDFRPKDGQKRVVFDGKDEARVVMAYMVIDNYSTMDITFNPDEATLITNTGETLKPLNYWTSTIDGNFTAGATKATSVAWALDDVDSDLSSIRIVIDPPVSKKDSDPLSEQLEVEIEILPY